jgi:hypothetical protein
MRMRPRRPADDREGYPHDPEHPEKPYRQVQRDIGSSLLLGAIVLIVLMALLVAGLS